MSDRRDKVVALSSMMNLETEALDLDFFGYEKTLYEKSIKMKQCNKCIRKCDTCKGMNITSFTESVTGFGTLNATVVFVGISPGTPCMSTQIPFSGGSGFMLDAACRLCGITREQVYITNIIHCHPEGNRAPRPTEIANCIGYLVNELRIIKPKLIITLGTIPRDIMAKFKVMDQVENCKIHAVKHPASFLHSSLIGSKDWMIRLSQIMEKSL